MLFHSLAFFVFLPVVVALHFAIPHRHRWALLLAASYWFYGAWKPEYLILIVLTTAVDWGVGLLLGREQREGRRRALLAASIVSNVGVLFAFKYLDFFSASFHLAVRKLALPFDVPVFDVLLPVGISFYTFQSISYAIDVYRRECQPEPHFGRFALYVAFFPQLVAGPIERASRLVPQFRVEQRWDFDRAVSGLGLVLWGLFKKVVVADRAAHFVDAVYGRPEHFQGLTIVAATYAFAFQIYADFSGYTDIAIGSAKILGFELMENFDRPYWATSIADFWRRWHISLSTWFRDYLYVPLGGNRVAPARRAVNLALVFLLSGLWHGAKWTFVLWGALHGALLIASLGVVALYRRLASGFTPSRALSAAARVAGVLLTFHFVCLGWMLFRADDLGHASRLFEQLSVVSPLSVVHELTHIGPAPAVETVELAILVASVATIEAVEHVRRTDRAAGVPVALRWTAWATLCVWVSLTAVQTHSPFIYFQF